MDEKPVNDHPREGQCVQGIVEVSLSRYDEVRASIELKIEMKDVELAMDEGGWDGMDSPRRCGQWPKQPQRSGWTTAERF